MIRLAVRCAPSSPSGCSPTCSSWRPAGSRRSGAPGIGSSTRSTAPRARSPTWAGAARRRRGDGLVEVTSAEVPDDWADRWADFHQADRGRRPPGCGPRGGRPRRASTSSSIPARRSAPVHPTTRLCLELLLGAGPEAEAPSGPSPTGARARACSRSPRPSWAPRSSPATTSRPRSRPPRQRRGQRGRARHAPRSAREPAPGTTARGADRGRQPDSADLLEIASPAHGRPPAGPGLLDDLRKLAREADGSSPASVPVDYGLSERRAATPRATGASLSGAGELLAAGRRADIASHEPAKRELPIAVFDSGVGGLTVLHECLVSLPEEDFVYLGDDARFPLRHRARTSSAPTSSRSRASCSTAARSCW